MVATDETTFNEILCLRSIPQLRLIIKQYQHVSGEPLEKAIKNSFSGRTGRGILAISETNS